MYFSCIITCYNREETILRSVNSVLAQTHADLEIIVVDDCSTDNSVTVIRTLTDSRVKLVEHDRNLGQNAALITGLSHSKHEYIAFLDSDDTWDASYLQEMKMVYEQDATADFVYCSLVNGDLWTLEGKNKYADVLNQGFLSSMITITAKKKAILDAGSFDLTYKICQDDDFCFRLSKNHSFRVIKRHLATVHGASNSMTRDIHAVARAWAKLFSNYKADIMHYCGASTYAKHLLNVSGLYLTANRIIEAMYYYFSACAYFAMPYDNKYPFSSADFRLSSKEIANTLLKKTKNMITKPFR